MPGDFRARETIASLKEPQVQYYHYDPDCSVAGLGTAELTGDQLGEIYHCNEPVAPLWKPVRVKVLDKRPKEAGDFPVLYDYGRLPVFSQRAWDVLSATIACRWEALPIIHPSKKPFYLIHVMEMIDCVEHARSDSNSTMMAAWRASIATASSPKCWLANTSSERPWPAEVTCSWMTFSAKSSRATSSRAWSFTPYRESICQGERRGRP